ncbi:MAG: hypothetical protein ACD_8C00056G0027 [uncultured bacterium]|nr:MAG: hypothetical protein ACD_8C00056G0027 [uncultured bacterium]
MPLNDLNDQLYGGQNSGDITKRAHEISEYDPAVNAGKAVSPFDQDEQWNKPQKGLTPENKKKIYIGIGIFFVIAFLIGGMFAYNWWTKNAFHQDRVLVSFEGLKEADSTKIMEYTINYENNNRVTLKNSFIQFDYLENFQPIDNTNLKSLSPTSSKLFIGDIAPMTKGAVKLKGAFYAPKDFPVFVDGKFYFTPSNGTTELYVENKIGIIITGAPVELSVSGSKQVVDGDIVEYVINYKNRDIQSISNAEMQVVLPQGFLLKNANPEPSESDSVWYLGSLEAGKSGEIRIRGRLSGSSGDGKNLIVTLGHTNDNRDFIVYDKQTFLTKMVSSVLTVVQKIENKDDDIINAGDKLKYSITFKNTGATGLRDAILTAEIKSKIIDIPKLDPGKGSYDSVKEMVIWKASDVPQLAYMNPGDSGTVFFSVPVKSIIPIDSALDKNLVVSSVAKIDSPDVPTPFDSNKIIGSNTLELKLASKVLFQTKGYYSSFNMKNTGPIPIKSGAETTFSIRWSIASVSNDITEARVVSSLPSGIRWSGQIYPTNEKISYNERTNQIIWEAGEIKAGAGILEPAREVEFQIIAKPQINQIGNHVNLVNEAIFTAKDAFVMQNITKKTEIKKSSLFEDSTVGFVGGKVVK